MLALPPNPVRPAFAKPKHEPCKCDGTGDEAGAWPPGGVAEGYACAFRSHASTGSSFLVLSSHTETEFMFCKSM